MTRLTRKYLRRLIVEELSSQSNLLEGEDEGMDIFGDEGGGEEEEAADEGGDEEAGDEGEEAAEGGEEEGGEEAGEEEAEEEGGDAEGETEESEEASGPADFQIDNEINAVMADFESEALEVAAVQSESKNRRFSLKKHLLEGEGEGEEIAIDVDNFAQNVARLIGNYQNLIDMEQVIFTKAKDFLADKYGEESATQLEDILATRFDITIDSSDPESVEAPVHAVGAMNAQV